MNKEIKRILELLNIDSDDILNEFLELLAEKSDLVSLMVLRDDVNDCEFELSFEAKTKTFFFTLLGDDDVAKRTLLSVAIEKIEQDLPFDIDNFTLEDIYDITSLTSDSSIFGLCRKMKLILGGC